MKTERYSEKDLKKLIKKFKSDLNLYDPLDIVRRHIVFGECAVITSEEYFDLRSYVAEKFQEHPNNVLVVGSGKLGFSVAPTKRYQLFGDRSDIDVVIVSERLFNYVWSDLLRYEIGGGDWEKREKFKRYLFQGWIRPDKLPPDQNFEFAKSWWEFFNELSASEKIANFKISGAIYQGWHFLESYQSIAIHACKQEVEA